MKEKNFFWFLKEPSDERESALFSLAYNRAFKFIMLALSAVFILTAKAEFNVPAYVIFFAVFLLLVVTNMVGWLTLKNEDVSIEEMQSAKSTPIWLLYGLPIIFGIYVVVVVFVFSKTVDIVQLIIFGSTLVYILLIAYSFLLTKPMPLYIRLILSLLYPLFAIFFVTSKYYSRSKLRAGLESIGYNIVLIISFAIVVLILRTLVFTPFYIKTDHFEPVIKKGQYVLLNKISKRYNPGDFVIYRAEERRHVFAQVKEVANSYLKVETASGIVQIDNNAVLGKMIRN